MAATPGPSFADTPIGSFSAEPKIALSIAVRPLKAATMPGIEVSRVSASVHPSHPVPTSKSQS